MRAPHLTVHPLSSSQREIWFDQMLHEGVALYNIGGWVHLPGAIDVEMFRTAVQMLIRRHDALRLVLMDTTDEDGMPLQKVVEPWTADVALRDFSGEADPKAAAQAWMQARFEEPFTLIGQPLWRYDLVKLGPAEYGWLLQYHHLIVDGWAIAMINRSLAEIYSSLAEQAWSEIAPSPSYTAFIAQDREYVESAAFERDRQYWLGQYASGAPEPLLQARHHASGPKSGGTVGSAVQSMHLPRAMYRALEALAAEQGASVFHVLLGALYVYFTRTGQREDFAVGLPVLNRSNAQMKATAGLFVGVTPTHFRFGQDLRFAELIQSIGKVLKGHYRHQKFPVSEVNRAVGRQASRSALFDVTLSFEAHDHMMPFAAVAGRFHRMHDRWAQAPLLVSVQGYPGEAEVRVDFVHNLAYLDEAEVQALQARFQTILTAVLESRAQPMVQQLPVMTDAEVQQLLAWNQTEQAYPADLTVVDLFEAQVDRTPEATAVVFEGASLSYSQLDQQANQVAHALVAQGVGPDTLVGLCVPRSLEMVVGLLGILKAGGAYVPLDPDYPPERLAFMVRDSSAPVVLTHSAVLERLPQSQSSVLQLDDAKVWVAQPGSRPARRASPGDLAYVIYTSGSTGNPKGVMIAHQALSNFLADMKPRTGIQSGQTLLAVTTLSFDIAALELYLPLVCGACVQLVSRELATDGHRLRDCLESGSIDLMQATPATWRMLLESGWQAHRPLTILCGGEALPREVGERLLERSTQLWNVYGPTETTIWSSAHGVTQEPSRLGSIGRPIANTRVYILDARQQPVPPGVPGELCIAGAGLARGYLNRPELTAEKFITAEVLGRVERLYRTGDLARWLPDGNLEYLGRLDHQVKLRGFRIELGEIESALSSHEAVSAAAVVLREREGSKSLAGYVVLRSAVEVSELKAWLKARLPDYMVPASVTVLDTLPLTPNGKVDRRALPEPELVLSTGWEAPRTAAEQTLCAIWSAVLRRPDVGIHDNFFDLGGDSILSIQIVARARQAGLGLSARDVFEHQSVAELAQAVRAVRDLDAAQGLLQGEVALHPIQARFLASARPAPWHYNQAMLLEVPATLDEAALRHAFAAVLSHHDALRLRYRADPLAASGWTQHFGPLDEAALPLHVERLDAPDEAAWVDALQARADHWQASLDLETGPLTRLVLLRSPGAPERTRLLWVIHHLAVDGVSWRILLEDLAAAYAQAATGAVRLPAKTSSVQAFNTRLARWSRSDAFAADAAHWQEDGQAAEPATALVADHPGGSAEEALTTWQTFTLDAELTSELLHAVPAAFRTGIQDVLVAALVLALHERSGQTRLRLDLESHGRAELFDDIDLGRTVGWFTSLYSAAFTLDEPGDPGRVLLAVKEALRAIPHEGLACGLLEQQGCSVPHGTVLFNYLGQFDQTAQEGPDGQAGWRIAREGAGASVQPGGQRSHLLAINGAITHGQLSLAFDYSTAQFEASSIQALITSYGQHLRALITHCRSHFGLSPSDFALAALDQPSLDRLSRDHGRGLEALYPLSPMQHGMLFHSLYAPGSGAYVTQTMLALGEVDAGLLRAAWQGLVERHAILRTAVRHDVQPPVQVVLDAVALPWREVDARALDTPAQAAQRAQLLQEDQRDFDFAQAPLMRLTLQRTGPAQAHLLWSHHHLLMDGWCLPILFQELFVLYEAARLGQPAALPPVQRYQHYIAWIARQDQAQARLHWRERLAGFDSPTPITIARHAPADTPKQPLDIDLTLDPQATAALQQQARAQRVTLNALVLAAWATVLGRYAGSDDVVFGATTSGRNVPLPGIEQMVGLFINTLPLRARLHASGLELARTLQAQQQADNTFAYSSLADIQAQSDIPGGTALFDSLIVFENYPVDEALKDQTRQPFRVEGVEAREGTNYALTLAVMPGQALHFRLGIDAARTPDAAARAMLAHFAQALSAIAEQPDTPVQQLELLTQADKAQLLAWNQTEADYPQDQTVVDLFEAQVDQTPEATAVVFEGETLSYAELDKQANQVAHTLIKRGVGPDTLVGLCVPRSLEMVVGLLGILKAGGAYVPLDPDYPAERLAFMVQDSNAPVVLTHSAVQERLPQSAAAVLRLDQPTAWASQPDSRPARRASPQDLAYVIYTSGSTGTPKGVAIEHCSLTQSTWARRSGIDPSTPGSVLLIPSFAFDAFSGGLWCALICGHSVHLPRQTTEMLELVALIRAGRIAHIISTPAWYQSLIELTSDPLSDLRQVIIGGEAATPALIARHFQKHPWAKLCNEYGPTEATVWSTTTQYRSATQDVNGIGRPIANTRVYILDTQQRLLPPGIPGELCIAGAGLARGYLNRPELTAEKFIEAEVLGREERLYRTGDLARWLPDGNLEYLGRLDHQVKLRGFRIELGEIESALSAHEAVSAAAVVLREREGSKALAGYVVLRSAVEVSGLKAWLKARLPEYMVPASVTVLEALPLTPNGKVDRRALPEPELVVSTGWEAPRTAAEQTLCAIWSAVLRRPDVGIHDNFFDLGGDSILSIQIVARARQAGLGLSARDVFEHQSVAELAQAVRAVRDLDAAQGLLQGEVALHPIQTRFLASARPAPWHYNQAMLLEVPATLDEAALRHAFAAVLSHHDALRLRYRADPLAASGWTQHFGPLDEAALPLHVERLDAPDEAAWVDALQARADHWQASLDLETGPLTRLVLLRSPGAPERTRLLWVIHHLAVDGVSWRILLEDLAAAYAQAATGAVRLPAKTSSVQAFNTRLARWSRSDAFAADAAHWQEDGQAAEPATALVADHPGGSAEEALTTWQTFTLDAELTSELLHAVPAAFRTGIQDVLVAALVLALHERSGQTRLRLDLESHGRAELFDDIDLGRTVGWFTSLYSAAFTLDEPGDPGRVLLAVKEALRAIPHEGLACGLLEQQGCSVPHGTVLFNYLGQFDQTAQEGPDGQAGWRIAREGAGASVQPGGQRSHLLAINGAITHGQLSLAFDYSTAQFEASSIQALITSYGQHLRALITHCRSHFGLSPSDFALAALDQPSLDRLSRDHGRGLEALYPLSPMQHGMLFHSLYAPGSGAYVTQTMLALGEVDAGLLRAAWQGLVERHAILRTAVRHDVQPPVQVVLDAVALPWREVDARALDTPAQAAQRAQLLQEDQRDFDFAQAPLMRLTLQRTGPAQAHLLWSHHHLLMDGWCLPILFQELFVLYEAARLGQPAALPPVQRYQHYIAWIARQDQAQARLHWRERLAGFDSPTPITIARHAPADTPKQPLDIDLTLDPQATAALQQQARAQRVTLNALVLAAWATVLGRYAGSDDVVFGATTSGRNVPLPGIEQMVGLFINTLPLRARLHASGLELARTLQAQQQADNTFAYSSLADIQAQSDIPGGTALFDSLIVFENYPVDEALKDQTRQPFRVEGVEAREGTNYALTLAVMPGQALHFRLGIDAARTPDAAARAMLAHFAQALSAIAEQPDTPVQQLELLTQADKAQLLAWNQTEADYPQDQTVVDLFEAQVDQTPEATAVVFEGETLSYAELDKQANQVAHTLIKRGVGPDTLVGLCVPRSLEMVVGLLGILKAGGAYVPLDPDYPAERLAFMVQDSNAPVVLTHSAVQERLPHSNASLLRLDEAGLWNTFPDSRPARRAHPDHLAYVIYTSGSTGLPKGVVNTVAGLGNRLRWFDEYIAQGQSIRTLLKTSLGFVDSITETLGALVSGGDLVVPPKTDRFDLDLIVESIRLHDVTNIVVVPELLRNMLEYDAKNLKSLRLLISSGEHLPVDLINQAHLHWPHVRLFNFYGSSEINGDSTYFECESNNRSTIGRPIANTRIYVLDSQLNVVPPGVAGELCIAGAGLARGYLNRPELTAEKFITREVLGRVERLYRTGDLARWGEDGNLEYLGRLDHQVKLRGFRIELGEIESALSAHEAVSAAAVVLREREGSKALAAYVVLRSEVDSSALKTWLKARLPEYMVPASVTVLEMLPLTPNGKVDRRALPEPDLVLSTGRALSGPTEELLGSIWAEVLGLGSLTAEAHFFELGGHSLLATRVASRVRERFGVECPLRVLFEQPVLTDLAAWLDTQQRGAAVEVIEPLAPGAALVLSPAQERLWFLAQLEGESATYNMPAALRLSGELDEAALRASLMALTARQASLRQSFPVDAAGQVRLHERSPWDPLVLVELQHLAPEAQALEVERLAQAHAQAPFDLAAGPLFKLTLLRLSPLQHVLLINLHHSIGDGWSIAVLVREWAELYRVARTGQAPALQALQPLPIAYRDVAAWQQRWSTSEAASAQLAWWVEHLQGAPALLELPTDFPRPAQQSYRGASFGRTLPAELSTAVASLARTQGATLFMTLLGALQVVLHRHSGQDDLCVGTPVANREHAHTEDLVGLFVNTLVLRSRLDPAAPFSALLAQTRQTALGAYARQALPFERVVEALSPERSLAHAPLFQVMFVLQNNDSADLELDGLTLSPVEQPSSVAKFDLTLSAQQTPQGITCHWEFATDLFSQARIERLASHFEQVLQVVSQAPDTPVQAIDLLTPADKAQLRAWNQTEQAYPADLTVVDLFEAQVDQTPDATAVVFEGESLSYAQLDQQANQVAHALIEQGIQPDTLVGLCVPRSLEMVVGLLGILKAGGAYVPLDPDYPTERLAFMVQDSSASVVLTHSAVLDRLPVSDAAVMLLDQLDAWASFPQTRPARRASPRDLAYVIYTSGSTGAPKGVLVEHLALALHLQRVQTIYQLKASDRVLQFAAFNFDASIEQLLGPWLQGATLVMPHSNRIAPDELIDLLQTRKVSVADVPPAYWRSLCDRLDIRPQDLNTLRLLILGGEALPVTLAQQTRRIFPVLQLLNAYGPTETVITSTIGPIASLQELQRLGSVPIGQPLANTRIYILDARQQPVPPGVPGELCIAGAGLARGYLNRPELTAEKFITAEVLGRVERLYRTGDLARWVVDEQGDGNLEYLGRLDHQVKLRGFRIELGEIESALCAHEAVSAAAVVLREREGSKALAAYVVLRSEVDSSALKTWLKARLPEYMVPASVTVLDALPLTPNGKVDRRALPEPELLPSHRLAPRTLTEVHLTRLWEDVLDVRPISIDASFFDLGGHSLLAIRLLARVQQHFSQSLPLATLFRSPTIAQLAEHLDAPSQADLPRHIVPIQPAGHRPALYGLPGAGGQVLYFHALARHLGADQPLYGLQTPGLDGTEALPDSVEAHARQLVAELRVHQPEGPYRLLGHSSGARVAFEMTRQLEQQGQTVEQLIVLDATPVSTEPERQRQRRHSRSAMDRMVDAIESLEAAFEQALDLPRPVLEHLPDEDSRWQCIVQRLWQRQIFPTSVGVEQVRTLFRVWDTAGDNHARYQPGGVVQAPVLLLRAQELHEGDDLAHLRDEARWNWQPHAQPPVQVQWVAGNHDTMLNEPQVRELAGVIRQALGS